MHFEHASPYKYAREYKNMQRYRCAHDNFLAHDFKFSGSTSKLSKLGEILAFMELVQ